jgi:hypothetical protein
MSEFDNLRDKAEEAGESKLGLGQQDQSGQGGPQDQYAQGQQDQGHRGQGQQARGQGSGGSLPIRPPGS